MERHPHQMLTPSGLLNNIKLFVADMVGVSMYQMTTMADRLHLTIILAHLIRVVEMDSQIAKVMVVNLKELHFCDCVDIHTF